MPFKTMHGRNEIRENDYLMSSKALSSPNLDRTVLVSPQSIEQEAIAFLAAEGSSVPVPQLQARQSVLPSPAEARPCVPVPVAGGSQPD